MFPEKFKPIIESRVSIRPSHNPEEITIDTSYHVLSTISPGQDGVMSIYIPEFKISFFAPNMEIGMERAEKMVNSYVRYWVKENSLKKFITEITRNGFRTDDLTLKRLLLNKPSKSNLVMKKGKMHIPDAFSSSNIKTQELQAVI